MDYLAKILSVAFGGAAGAVARYLINISPVASLFGKFPFATFLINVSGSFLIGLLFILLNDKLDFGENVRIALIVGFLGAFTTFSTFEIELLGLMKERLFITAIAYMLFSVTVGLVAVAAGIQVGRKF
ncbi:MAG: fluoride efflux transporter CrcB [Pyrinomonadaceae bacterium]